MTIDITDQALKELLANYVRKRFPTTHFSDHKGNMAKYYYIGTYLPALTLSLRLKFRL